jgi:hypothetical protein
MRSAGNFHPEWGYLAPAPSFMRTARIALVATAIGATAGAVVVVSLVARPGAETDTTSIAAHALVTTAPVVSSPLPPDATLSAPSQQASAPAEGAVASAQSPMPTSEPAAEVIASKPVVSPPAPAHVAVLDPSTTDPDATDEPETAASPKPAVKKRHSEPYDAARRWQSESAARKRWRDNRGFEPLFRLFSFRSESEYSN